MEADIKILKLLIGKKEEKFTIRKIAETLKINYRTAYENVAMLNKEGLLKITAAGNSKICEFAKNFNNKVYEAEYTRREELFSRDKNFLVLHRRLAELNFVFVALLFGSHAKGTANRNSDIDILAIGGDEKEIKKCLSLLPDKIHLTYTTYSDFISMAKSREFTAASEAIRNNIILTGIEEYYRLLKNAGYGENQGS